MLSSFSWHGTIEYQKVLFESNKVGRVVASSLNETVSLKQELQSKI